METQPKKLYWEPASGQIFTDVDECKDALIDSSASDMFNLLKKPEQNYTKNADDLWDNREEIIKQAKFLIQVLTDPDKKVKVFVPHAEA